jgi:hypothetical protein
MTQSAEDCARAILRIFSAQDVRAGHALMYSAVNVQFLEGYSAEDSAGIRMNGVAYRASNQQMQDLVGGQISNFSSAWEQVKAGKIRALAITSAKRYSFAPLHRMARRPV